MGYITYKQADSRWGKKNYNGSSTMATAGCGPTSVAMLAYAVDGKTTPWDVALYMKKNGYAIRNNGTAWAGIPAAMKKFGLTEVKNVNVDKSMAEVWKYLEKGLCADFLFRAGTRGGITWTTAGHYIAVTDYKVKNGKHYLYTRDSGGRNHTGWYCYETQMKGLIPKVWVGLAKKKEEKPVSKPTGKYSGTIAKPTLKRGSTGVQVEYLQKFLKWYLGIKLKVDQDFGPATEEALEKFQVAEGLTKDGVYGTKSYKKANSYKEKKTETPTTPSTPVTKETKVVDVSYWQHTIDWAKVAKDGITGAILRTSYTSQSSFSLDYDSTFDKNLTNATKNGIAVGAYHYSQAISVSEAKKEAEYICAKLNKNKEKITLPVVCDWEFGGRLSSSKAKSLGKATCTKIVSAFCNVVKSYGYRPMVYANYNTFSNYLDTATLKKKYLIWLAQYASKASMDYDMWQYSSSGSVKGISGKVDVNKSKINPEPYKAPEVPKEPEQPKHTAKDLVKIMDKISWPYGTAKAKWEYKTGSPTDACKTAMKKYGYNTKAKFSDCGDFVNTVVRESGIDTKFTSLRAVKTAFPKSETKFDIVLSGKKIPDGFLKAGDIIRYKKTTNSQHAMMYYGDGKVCDAGHYSRFGHIYKDDKRYNKSNVKHDTLQVLRLK